MIMRINRVDMSQRHWFVSIAESRPDDGGSDCARQLSFDFARKDRFGPDLVIAFDVPARSAARAEIASQTSAGLPPTPRLPNAMLHTRPSREGSWCDDGAPCFVNHGYRYLLQQFERSDWTRRLGWGSADDPKACNLGRDLCVRYGLFDLIVCVSARDQPIRARDGYVALGSRNGEGVL